ncbi:MAG: hypothetical protein ACLFRG_13615 [Desulfococcaceae bacterium]
MDEWTRELPPPIPISVSCYAGYRGEETPRRFALGENRVEVQEVMDRWLAPDHRYFKLRSDDGAVYILRHDSVADRWELVLHRKSG